MPEGKPKSHLSIISGWLFCCNVQMKTHCGMCLICSPSCNIFAAAFCVLYKGGSPPPRFPCTFVPPHPSPLFKGHLPRKHFLWYFPLGVRIYSFCQDFCLICQNLSIFLHLNALNLNKQCTPLKPFGSGL